MTTWNKNRLKIIKLVILVAVIKIVILIYKDWSKYCLDSLKNFIKNKHCWSSSKKE